jgi:hypothetical protein
MRDFRDAKAMAHTLRDALKPKILLSQSESLELIARILGFQDWNVLSARIQSGEPPSRPADVGKAGKIERQEIQLQAAILDRYVGFYRLSERMVMTIRREGDQLISRLTGQPSVPLFAESQTAFFAKVVNAQIDFATDKSGQAESLTLHQNGRDIPMPRIDATEARRIEDALAEKLKSQTPSPGTEPALRRLIEGLRTGKPNYAEMSPALVEATQRQWPDLRSEVGEAGSIQSIQFIGVGNGGADIYLVQHEHQTKYWRIGLDPQGIIVMAWVSSGL